MYHYTDGQRFRVKEDARKVKRRLRGLGGTVLRWTHWDEYVVSIDGEQGEFLIYEHEMGPEIVAYNGKVLK